MWQGKPRAILSYFHSYTIPYILYQEQNKTVQQIVFDCMVLFLYVIKSNGMYYLIYVITCKLIMSRIGLVEFIFCIPFLKLELMRNVLVPFSFVLSSFDLAGR